MNAFLPGLMVLLLLAFALWVGGRRLARDKTRREIAEADARASGNLYQSLVEHAPFGVERISATGRPISANPALVQMLGYTSESEILSLDIARDVYRNPDERAPLVDQLLDSGEMTAESQWRKKDGSFITVRRTGTVVRNADGSVMCFDVFIEDVSTQRALEAQLESAGKMEAIGRVAGGVAHDFNNLLTVILGSCEILIETLPANSQVRSDITDIRSAAMRASELTTQLLAFSRRQVLQPVVLDLNRSVEGMEQMVKRLIGEDVELAVRLDPALGTARADPGQIEQVIMNLAVNARDAMPQGGLLTIETANAELDATYSRVHPLASPGSYVMVAVSDSGVGMDEDTKAHVFEPFFTTKEQGKGTGLGLATVYGIVRQSGGFIWVYSEPGQGATFKIYLPRVGGTPQPAERKEPAKVRHGTETILLVEDDPPVRAITRRVLVGLGYSVLPAHDGATALDIAATHRDPIQLVVTDAVMPRMSGQDLAATLRSRYPAMRLLLLSGYPGEAISRRGILVPGTAFLQKPFTVEALARKVRDVLDAPVIRP
ncbi:MAG TPA: ATP-binding protein [Gemmatimonadales bacterium]|nr:ATP-binding protein [Gemmatimonadales bacterium]